MKPFKNAAVDLQSFSCVLWRCKRVNLCLILYQFHQQQMMSEKTPSTCWLKMCQQRHKNIFFFYRIRNQKSKWAKPRPPALQSVHSIQSRFVVNASLHVFCFPLSSFVCLLCWLFSLCFCSQLVICNQFIMIFFIFACAYVNPNCNADGQDGEKAGSDTWWSSHGHRPHPCSQAWA